jgi:hypothetical protein
MAHSRGPVKSYAAFRPGRVPSRKCDFALGKIPASVHRLFEMNELAGHGHILPRDNSATF